jgi:hypothetical protein
MPPPSDSLLRIEHDHMELSAIVGELRAIADAIDRGEREPADAYSVFSDNVHDLIERMVVHFDREEQGLFPLIARELPDTQSALRRLESGHDMVCGALLRIAGMAREGAGGFPGHWPAVAALFRRFDRDYGAHAREETTFLRDLGGRLDEKQRAMLMEVLNGI